jgi:hypothetical protein
MPKIIIHTNIKDADISTDFEEKVALKVSETINYPLEVNSLHKLFVSLRMSAISHLGPLLLHGSLRVIKLQPRFKVQTCM